MYAQTNHLRDNLHSQRKLEQKKKNQEPEIAEESHTEVHMQEKENETRESHLMDEAMADMDDIIQDLPTNSRAQNAMKFLIGTGCTPPASTPPGPVKKKTPRKSVKNFAPPRQKKYNQVAKC
ncbi:hypothetical protein POM88_035215 [Heracleum sosnowskyi]|uniref:Uncharacterized protein n=1 Tax=Heracleum sosnowskyi TaxID=360622 RepID=A0AAD8MEG6_9APIA|nr:hypothetical protein POM88_035215 [Heracleum sosnowskyi]